MDKAKATLIFKRFAELNPQPTTELIYHSIFELLIAVMLSAQATDVSVNKATRLLFMHANTPQAIVNLGVEGLKQYIKSIGLYNTKAENVYRTCILLLQKYAGEVPCRREELESLPGVGRKTANVVLNIGFGEATIPVDTHIFRVANRTGLACGTTHFTIVPVLIFCLAARTSAFNIAIREKHLFFRIISL